jgi:hypothetical protein
MLGFNVFCLGFIISTKANQFYILKSLNYLNLNRNRNQKYAKWKKLNLYFLKNFIFLNYNRLISNNEHFLALTNTSW